MSESVAYLEQVHIRPQSAITIDAGVGKVLEPIPRNKRMVESETDARGTNNLERPPEVLNSKCVITEKTSSESYIDSYPPIFAIQGDARDKCAHEAGFSCTHELACAGN